MKLSSKAIKRLDHVKAHLDAGFNKDVKIKNIKENLGNPAACASGLSSHALAMAIFSWFKNEDILNFKKWLYVGFRLDQLYYKIQEVSPNWGRGTPSLFNIVFCDDDEIIEWICSYELAYDLSKINNPETPDFLAYQSIVALRGDWEKVLSRCKMVEDDSLAMAAQQNKVLDFQFFRNLASGNIELMEENIALMVSESENLKRVNQESGFTRDLISTDAAIYAKIAWRSGYFLNVNSQYIPKEWLPVAPLGKYDLEYDFL